MGLSFYPGNESGWDFGSAVLKLAIHDDGVRDFRFTSATRYDGIWYCRFTLAVIDDEIRDCGVTLAMNQYGIWDVPFSLAICDGCSGFGMNLRFAVLPLAIRYYETWDCRNSLVLIYDGI